MCQKINCIRDLCDSSDVLVSSSSLKSQGHRDSNVRNYMVRTDTFCYPGIYANTHQQRFGTEYIYVLSLFSLWFLHTCRKHIATKIVFIT